MRTKWFAKATHAKIKQVYNHPGSLASDFWTRLASSIWIIGNPPTDAQQLSQGFWSLQKEREEALCPGNMQYGTGPEALLKHKAQKIKEPHLSLSLCSD